MSEKQKGKQRMTDAQIRREFAQAAAEAGRQQEGPETPDPYARREEDVDTDEENVQRATEGLPPVKSRRRR